jgi:hypothetical protein
MPLYKPMYKILVGKHREKAIFPDLYYGDYTKEMHIVCTVFRKLTVESSECLL